MNLLSTALEERALLGKIGAKFDTPEKAELLMHYRRQQAIANRLMFYGLLPREVLDQVAKLIGFAEPSP